MRLGNGSAKVLEVVFCSPLNKSAYWKGKKKKKRKKPFGEFKYFSVFIIYLTLFSDVFLFFFKKYTLYHGTIKLMRNDILQ